MKKIIYILPILLSLSLFLFSACDVFSGVLDERWKGPRIIVAQNGPAIFISDDKGDTWATVSIPSSGFTHMAASSDYMKLAATHKSSIYTSSNGGLNWTTCFVGTPATTEFSGIAISGDGTKIFASETQYNGGQGYIHSSTDGGISFTIDTNPAIGWFGLIAMTSDWTKGIRIFGGGAQNKFAVYSSGVWSWSTPPSFSALDQSGLAMSADGMKIAITGWNSSTIRISTDGGSTWSTVGVGGITGSRYIACSDDGMKLALTDASNGFIYTSTDGGLTWTQRTASGSHSWGGIASSADGQLLVAGEATGYIYISRDSGVTWKQITSIGSIPLNTLIIK